MFKGDPETGQKVMLASNMAKCSFEQSPESVSHQWHIIIRLKCSCPLRTLIGLTWNAVQVAPDF